jgi:cell division septation protein DedD
MRLNATVGMRAIALVIVLCVAGCSHEGADWKAASTADSAEAYQQFLQQHPKSNNAVQARARIAQLQEERDWQGASSADTRDAYEQFVAQHPDSKWAQEARIRIENFAQASPPAAVGGNATPAPSPPIGRHPVAAAPAAAAAPGMRFVQLGAFSSQAHAQVAWSSVSGKYPQLLGSLNPRYVSSKAHGHSIVRLEVGVATHEAAKSLCGKLKKQGQTCVPLKA